ncbi:MAG: poly-beta,6-N-acetyl-D-glucosamine synthase [Patescibacteria group bacterium]|nr:poly-beta,6-N-acetyl-D-glucosamine synthase [Patescibacteria group bacterium]
MLLTVLYYIFIVISIINVIHFGFYLVGANYYDILRFRAAAKAKKNTKKLPLVSLLIPAHNEELGIVRCLETISKSTYKNLEIIVIDDKSKDATKRLVREYITSHPKQNITLMYKNKNVGKAGALNHALRHRAKGNLVMTLDADSVLHKDAIRNAVRYFNDPDVVGVAANVRVMDSYTILGLLQKFEYMIGYRSKKFFSVTNSEFIVGGVASTYRMNTLKKVGFYSDDIQTEDIALSLKVVAQGNKKNKVIYGVDVLAMTEGVQTFKALMRQRYRWKLGNLQALIKNRQLFANNNNIYSKTLTWYRIPMAFFGELIVLLEPLVIAYVIYISMAYIHSSSLIVGAYMTITIYLTWNIMPDEHMTLAQKLKMIAYAPVMYFIMYLMNIVQFTAIIRCLLSPKKMMLKSNASSLWVSPERNAQAVAQF